jgi:KDO2-lipid IV(A) lauroyltransferase
MSALLYYLVMIPLSYLPLGILYLLSDGTYLILTRIIPYRKKLILKHLKTCFPHYTQTEINALYKSFMHHFCDLLVEGLKNLTISEKSLRKRMLILNPGVMDALYKQKKNVVLVAGHYNNWEWFISLQARLFHHQAFGIGMPMSNSFFNQKINQRRGRFGMNVVHAKNYKESLQNAQRPFAVLNLSDQSPGDSMKSYWTSFLGQKTAVLFGTEIIANQFDCAVVFFKTRKIKRGYYTIELEVLTENARSCNWGEVTKKHVHSLEKLIAEHPEYWLWSHNRWKRNVPENIEALKNTQREYFNQRFRSL